MATISRLLKVIGLFCKRTLQKRLYSAKETYNFKEPTKRSQPIVRKKETERAHNVCMVRVCKREMGGGECVCVCECTCMCVRMHVQKAKVRGR